jgi:hypothetical protein
MAASPSTVLTRGIGSWGSTSLILTRGLGQGAVAAAAYYPPQLTVYRTNAGTLNVNRENAGTLTLNRQNAGTLEVHQ